MSNRNCEFCKIQAGEYNTGFLFEDDRVVAFKDINPQAPLHILIIPREHFDSLKQIDNETLIGHMFTAAKRVAERQGITDYRLVINTGPQVGQSVFHLHMHLLAGRQMFWPPG